MKRLFHYADKYLEKSNWKDLAMVKFCLFSMGIMVGMQLPKEKKKYAWIGAVAIFVLTYVILMAKFLGIVMENCESTADLTQCAGSTAK